MPSGWSQWSSNGTGLFATALAEIVSRSPTHWFNLGFVQCFRPGVGGCRHGDAVTGVQADILVSTLIPVQLIAGGEDLSSGDSQLLRRQYYPRPASRAATRRRRRANNTKKESVASNLYLSGKWVQTSLTFNGEQLSVQVFRTDTSQYLNAAGNWVATPATALQATDAALSRHRTGRRQPARQLRWGVRASTISS